jgi:hypothetical protein
MFLCACACAWCVCVCVCVDRFESLLAQYQNIRYHVMHVVSERLKVGCCFSVARQSFLVVEATTDQICVV